MILKLMIILYGKEFIYLFDDSNTPWINKTCFKNYIKNYNNVKLNNSLKNMINNNINVIIFDI